MSYIGAALLAGAGIWFNVRARTEESFVADLESSANTALPLVDSQSVHAAIECLSHSTLILPTNNEPVLLGRVSVKETSTSYGEGIAFTYGSSGLSPGVTSTTSIFTNIVQFGFPEKLLLESKTGPVTAKNLDLAIWDGSYLEKDYHKPKDCTPLLRTLGIRSNLSADNYEITTEWFKGKNLTVFGCVTRTHEGIIIGPSTNNRHFIITQKTPQDFIQRWRASGAKHRGRSYVFALSALILALGTVAFEKQEETKRSLKALKD